MEIRVSRMRAKLTTAGCADHVVAIHKAGYSLEVESDAVDAARFRTQVSRARGVRAGDPAHAAATLKAALDLWRGDAFGGLAGGPLDAPRFGLDELRVQAWEDLIELETDLGRHLEVLPELGRLIQHHPFRERLVYLHMTGLARAGRSADALQAFHRFRQRLKVDLGLSPGEEVQRLYQSLIRNESPRLAVASAPKPAQLPLARPGFVGRNETLSDLQGILTRDQSATTAIVVILGTAGVGKPNPGI